MMMAPMMTPMMKSMTTTMIMSYSKLKGPITDSNIINIMKIGIITI